jgi:Zn finger protein HypA/HybF involved in hydrogenase expression
MARKFSSEFAHAVMAEKGLLPLEDFINVTSPWKYKCLKCENEGVTTLHKVKNHGSGCPYCGGVKVDPKKMDRMMKAAQLVPLEPYKSNTSKWKVLHEACGNEVVTTWAEVQSGQGGCGICRYTKIATKLRRSDESAIQMMREAGGEPLEPYKNNHTKWKVRCLRCSKISHPLLSNVTRGQGICMYCRPKSPVVTKKQALSFIKSKNMASKSEYETAHRKWLLTCLVCHKTDFYIYSQMKSQNYGCVYCSKHKVDPADALKLFRKMGFEPLGPYENARKPIKAKCLNCNRSSLKRYDDVRTGRGCKYCQTAALDLLAPTYYYIMKNFELDAIKVGIGNLNRRQDRIKQHQKSGWVLFYSFELDNGELALQLEQAVLVWLRQEMKLPIFLSKSEMPQGGWTETVGAESISVLAIRDKFEELFKESFI